MKLLLHTILPYAAHKVRYAYRCPVNHENDYEAELDIFNKDELNCLINYSEYFLLLRPLSDYCGKMIAKDAMSLLDCDFETINEIWDLDSGAIKLEDVKLKTYNTMCKNHIDFNGLIDQRKAIDINTL
jgi:hypothetical protein